MSTYTDAWRHDEDYCGLRDHTGDGDTWSTQPSEPCRRQAPPVALNQARRGPCPGRIFEGVCDWCQRPPRETP